MANEAIEAEIVWPEWVVEYQFDGSRWGVKIAAPDATEAGRRLRAIGMTGQVLGKLEAELPVGRQMGAGRSILSIRLGLLRAAFGPIARGG
jgi:hypothetical protein